MPASCDPATRCPECGGALPCGWAELSCPACSFGFALNLLDTGAGAPAETGSTGFTELGDYAISGELGRGGMGVVFRARQRSLNRPVALKMILAGQLASPESVQRFRMEAETAAGLHHPNILPVYEVGEHETFHYFTMRLLEPATSISTLALPEQPSLEQQRAVAGCLAKVARAVAFAHSHGVLHRDLKPANVLMDADGEPFVCDFGLAKVMHGSDSHLTLTCMVLGSPSYLSPEQAAGNHDAISTATDVYGLGAILYELLTSRPPFKADSAVATLHEVRESSVVRPGARRAALHPDLEMICLRCLEKTPEHRYPGAAEVVDELERFVRGEPVLARPVPPLARLGRWAGRRPVLAGWMATALLATAAGAAGVLWQWRESVSARRMADARSTQLAENLYFSNIDRIIKARSNHDFGLGRSLLESLIPKSGEPDPRGLEWRLLKGLCEGDDIGSATIPGGAPGTAAAWSADGSHIWLTTRAGEVQIWDAAALKPINRWQPEGAPGVAWSRLQFSPDGMRLALTGPDEIRVIDAATHETLFHEAGGHPECAWRDRARLLVSRLDGPRDQTADGVWQIHLEDGNRRELLAAGLHAPLAVSQDGSTAAAGMNTDSYRVWNLATGTTTGEFKITIAGGTPASLAYRGWQLSRLAVAPRGSFSAAAWSHPVSGTRILVHSPAQKTAVSMEAYSRPPAELAFSPAADAILIAEQGSADFRRINYLQNRPKEFSTTREEGRPAYPVFDDHCEQPDPAIVSGEIPLGLPGRYYTRSAFGRRTQFLLGHAGAVTGAAWNPSATALASVSQDGTLRLWEEPVWNVGRIAVALNMADGPRPVMSADGNYFAYLRSVFDTSPMIQIRRTGKSSIAGSGHPVAAFTGGTVLCYLQDGAFQLHRILEDARLEAVWTLPAPALNAGDDPRNPKACAVTEDERFVAGVAAGRVFVVDCQSRTVSVSDPLPDPVPRTGGAVDVAASPGARWIAVTGYGARALLLDLTTLKPLPALTGAAAGRDVSVCAGDDASLFTGCADGSICHWNPLTGALLNRWQAHAGEVAGVAIHPDKRWLVSSGTKELKIWNADGARERCSIPLPGALNWLRFPRDGGTLFQSGVWMALEGWPCHD